MFKLLMMITVSILVSFGLTLMPSTSLAGCGTDHGAKVEASKAKITGAMKKVETPNIVETAVAAGNFTTLVAAVKAAGLAETLQGDGPFTVFAPTDDAFAKLPKGTVENLLKDKEKLAAILTYHVVPGKVMAADVVKLDKAMTVNGQDVTISASDEMVMVDKARVTATDIVCDNGVIHVIDSVILPN